MVRDEGPKEKNDRLEPEQQGGEDDREISRYEIMEAATKDLSGIFAICTAEAITWLWNWKSAEDLQEAKAAIDYMLQRMEAKNGKV